MSYLSYTNILRGLPCCAVLVLGGAAISAAAQTTTPAPTQAEPASRRLPTSAEVTAQTANEESKESSDQDVVVLSPFNVSGEADTGYQAKTTLAATRLRTNLDDVGDALQIVTRQFMKDIGATSSQSLLTYTTGTEVGGLYGNWEGNGNGQTVYEQYGSLSRPDLNTRIRGLSNADNTRDFEGSDIPWDSYNVDTVEVQRGANAILFGLGSPSGLVNASLRQANYKESGELTARYGSYGSIRGSLEVNHVLLKDELAVRVNLLRDHEYYEEEPAFNKDTRLFGALRYDPKFLNRGSAHTTLRANFEQGSITADNPRTLPPVDEITPWFQTGTTTVGGVTYNNLNQGIYNFNYSNSYLPNVPNSGALVTSSPNYRPNLTGLYQGSYAYFPNPDSGEESGSFYAPAVFYMGQQYGIGPGGAIDGSIGGLVSNGLVGIAPTQTAAIQAGLPFAASYKQSTLRDPGIFDFYHKLIDGPNRSERQRFQAFNVTLSQTFFDDHVGIEAVYDRQRYQSENYDPYYGNTIAITVDVNSVRPDGSPNPNVGRPYISTSSYYGGGATQTLRQDSRLTGFVDFKADDFLPKSWLTEIIGRHVFTGLLNYTSDSHNTQSWAANAFSPLGSTADPDALVGSPLDPFRWFQQISYLGPDMRGLKSAGGLDLSNVTATQRPASTNNLVVFDSKWTQPTNPGAAGYVNPAAPWVNPLFQTTSTQSENPANYVGYVALPVQTLESTSDANRLLTSANQQLDTVSSQVLVWQGYLFNGAVVPTVGYRRDTAKSYTVGAPITALGIANVSDPNYILPSNPFNRVTGTSTSYSLVAHTPMFIRKHLPYDLNFSLFINSSKNFEPSSGRVDVMNQPIAAPTGRTKDYGFMISAFKDRLSLKVTKYEARASGASYGVINEWLTGDLIVRDWVWAKRLEAGLSGDPAYAGASYNYGTNVNGVFTQTAADIAEQQADVNAVLSSPFVTNPAFWEAWKMPVGSPGGMSDARWQQNAYEPWSNGLGGIYPTGMTATSDNVSTGYEFELYFKPTDNWDITMNAAKTKAVQTNIAGGTTLAFMMAENELFNGPAGQIRSNGTDPSSAIVNAWNANVWNNFELSQLLNGSNNAELRPWRFNIITNYRFTRGRLNGFNAGGAYQWQDKIAIGYPSIYSTINGSQVESFDITKPFLGPVDTTVSLWAGYTRKITKAITWHIQLNVVNVFGKNELIPINTQPDGATAAYRIKNGPGFTLTNTFDF